MPDTFLNDWGLAPSDLPKPPDVGVGPTKSFDENQFNQDWLGQPIQTQPVQPIQSAAPPSLTDRLLHETTIGRILTGIAGGVTLPGDVYYGKTAVDPSDPNFIARVTNLGSVFGTGAMPIVGGVERALMNPADANLAALAIDKYGIPIRGGQLKPGSTANYLDNIINGGSGEQHAAFNAALAKTIGEDADKLTPDVMANAKERLGNNYDTVAANTTLQLDSPMISRLASTADASKYLTGEEKNAVVRHINNIIDVANKNGGEIPGEAYQNLVRKGSPLDVATQSSNSNVRFYANQIKDTLIDGLNRYAPADMQSLLRTTNAQYKAMKTIEPLAEKAPTGDISPALLLNQVRNKYDIAYGGGGDLADLGRIGQRFLKEPPQSGTAPRLGAMRVLGLGGLGGAEAGLAFHDPIMAAKLAGLGVGAALARSATKGAIGSVLRSDWYTNRLINSALPDRAAAVPNQLQKLLNGNMPYLPPAAMLALEHQTSPQPQASQGYPTYQ